MAIEAPMWIYWLFCLAATIPIIVKRSFAYQLLSPDSESSREGTGYKISLFLGWATTLLAAVVYILFTVKHETGPYQLWDLILFSLLNGTLEQFMFIFWFLVGCYLGQRFFQKRPIRVFVFGYVSYALYSGLIHPFFWFRVLPAHDPFTPVAPILAFMSIFWMWLLWRHRSVISIISMHIFMDFLAIGHLHFGWFEPFQLV
jgi:hypothetical protein